MSMPMNLELEVRAKIDELSTVWDRYKTHFSQKNVGSLPYRVIHYKGNPSQIEIDRKLEEFERLRRENQQLKARLDILQSGSAADISSAINTAVNSSAEMDKLKKKVEIARLREENLLKTFRKNSLQYREVCYLLTGWKIDALKDGLFRLSNMYAEHEEDYLLFQIQSDGEIQLLENEYSNQLNDYIRTYLVNAESFPAFLASITLDLYKSTTQLQCMSMVMT